MYKRLLSVLKNSRILASIGLILLLGLLTITAYSIPPSEFPRNVIIKIPSGTTVSEAGKILKEKGIIRSTTLYKVYVILINGSSGIQKGDYLFDKSISAISVAHRTANGEQNIQKKKITIPEGSSTKEIATIIKRSIPEFDDKLFVEKAKEYEGYLFPETYYFFPNVTPSEVIKEMRTVFDQEIAIIEDKISMSKRSREDIIIMASILEEEANNAKDRKVISGILWKRIDTGMPIQVDAPFYYTLGKGSLQLLTSDLRADGPYNTYTRKGLPPTPISNPGIASIEASLYPETSAYWFFLSDKSGTMHYAVTHDGHVENKWKYLQ
jgi:UPF0755 protein